MDGSTRRRVLFAPVVLGLVLLAVIAAFRAGSDPAAGTPSASPAGAGSTSSSTSSTTAPAGPTTTPSSEPAKVVTPPRPAVTTTTTVPAEAVKPARPWSPRELYVDPSGRASQQAYLWRDSNPEGSALMVRVATVPQARWFVNQSSSAVGASVDGYVSAAARAGAMPVLVAYHIPNRDCAGYSAGGATSVADYQAWIEGVVAGIGNRPAVVILEPDALAHLTNCLDAGAQQERLDMLRAAVVTLEANPATWVYLDAGNPLTGSASTIASRLERAGVAQADGFSLNVSNFQTTDANIAYGRSVSSRLDGKHFVIDTSRNGNGPAEGNDKWCNPAGRALGATPVVDPGPNPLLDAVVWIKTPGQSDGTCNGGPSSGTWWPEYLEDLARQAGW